MIFGRGGGGGVINRVLKEADGTRVREVTVGGGQFDLGRVAVDFGDAINPNVAARFNAVYENSGSYRDFGHLERYGFNPTVTFKPTDATTIALSYEYFHDAASPIAAFPRRRAPASRRNRPRSRCLPYLTSPSTFFGNPEPELCAGRRAYRHGRDRARFRQRPEGEEPRPRLLRSIRQVLSEHLPAAARRERRPARRSTSAAYNNQNDRNNLFNQTDFTYKIDLGFVRHTLWSAPKSAGRAGISFRAETASSTGRRPRTASPVIRSRSTRVSPMSFTFRIVFNATDHDANSRYKLDLAAALCAGPDRDHALPAADRRRALRPLRLDERRTGTSHQRRSAASTISLSPRVGVVVQAVREPVVLRQLRGVVPAERRATSSRALNPRPRSFSAPEKFENQEIGVKWDIFPRLQFTAADLRSRPLQSALADPTDPRLLHPERPDQHQGFETGLVGYISRSVAGVGRLRLHRRQDRRTRSRHHRAGQPRRPGAVPHLHALE